MVAPGSAGHHPGVDFAQAQQVFLTPPDPERPPAEVPDTPARRLRDAAEPIATISIWGRQLNERLSALGLNFLTGYVWARAAPMGEPAAPVVVAAFGRSEEHTSELQSRQYLVCRLLLEKKKYNLS